MFTFTSPPYWTGELREQVNTVNMPPQLYKFALRIDKEFEKTREFLQSKNISGIGVREVSGNNEHWHFHLETLIKPSSFRVLLKRGVPGLQGNGCYSVSEVKDVDKYLRYICKGDGPQLLPEVSWKLGPLWTDERIEELHTEYWEANAAMKKRRTESVSDVVIDRCKELGVAWDDRTAIAEEYIKELVERSKPVNIYSVRSNVNLIQIKLCPDESAIRMLASQVHI